MTISAEQYFKQRKSDRKKETRYLAVINKDSCTSCNACATMCPVDCIYEVVSHVPSESYHQIDTSRCIGCQLCYRIPTESSDRFTLEVCPWNAIDMIHNPNVKPSESPLVPYYQGTEDELPWPKMEEYAYQFFLDGEVFLPVELTDMQEVLAYLQADAWFYGDDETCRLIYESDRTDIYVRYRATDEGRAVLDVVFEDYDRLFMD